MATAFVRAELSSAATHHHTADGGQLSRRGEGSAAGPARGASDGRRRRPRAAPPPRLDWSQSTMVERGGLPVGLAHEGIVYIDQLSTESFHEYMTVHADVLKPATLMKFRCYARSLVNSCKRNGPGSTRHGETCPSHQFRTQAADGAERGRRGASCRGRRL